MDSVNGPEGVLESNNNEIQMAPVISTRRPDLVIVQKKKKKNWGTY